MRKTKGQINVAYIVVEEKTEAVGLGKVSKDGGTLFMVPDWEWVHHWDYHITIGWNGIGNIHNVPKDSLSLL